MAETAPKTLGRYEIVSEIGRGMMGVVYQAKDPTLGRIVALKTINVAFAISEAERGIFEQRFMNEARLAAGLSHPNIVVVHDVGWEEATRTPYIALEFLKGTTLSDLVPPPMEWREALRLTARLADALHHAHQHKIVHRDIKPANVMVLPNKEPKLMDFGIARAPASDLTAAGEFFGTPSYMSPEQALGEPLDGRSDLFSLGAVLYFLLTGKRAFEGKTVPAILAKVERETPPAPASLAATIPRAVDLVVLRMLEKRPEHRYQDGLQLGEDIDDVLHDMPPRHAAIDDTLQGDPTLRASEPRAQASKAGFGIDTNALKLLEGPRALLAIAGLLVGGLLVALYMQGGSPAASPAASVVSPAASAPGPAVSTSPSARARSPGPAAAPSASARPVSTTVPANLAATAAPRGARASPAPGPTPRPAQLSLNIEHNVKEGTLRVLVDQTMVLEKPLSAQETRKAVLFKGRKGEMFEVVDVAPGDHTIRVEVEDGRVKKAQDIKGAFQKGQARLLKVKIGGRVELEWQR